MRALPECGAGPSGKSSMSSSSEQQPISDGTAPSSNDTVMVVIFAPRSSSILGLIIQAKENSHESRKPYAVPVIVAFVCFAIVLMLWATHRHQWTSKVRLARLAEADEQAGPRGCVGSAKRMERNPF
jgi:hypothetical protein